MYWKNHSVCSTRWVTHRIMAWSPSRRRTSTGKPSMSPVSNQSGSDASLSGRLEASQITYLKKRTINLINKN